jgi:glutaminyl-peptide cyclotransferase
MNALRLIFVIVITIMLLSGCGPDEEIREDHPVPNIPPPNPPPKADPPKKFSYKVEKVIPHDTSSYTQGLEFVDGFFYESDGQFGESSLRKVDVLTGKVLQMVPMPDNIFAEGISVVGDKIIQLTWRNDIGIIYDKKTFKQLDNFPYGNSREGWGLCADSNRLYKSDGSNRIYFLNKENYQEEGYISVYNDKGPVEALNELELIDGKIYANVYMTERIVIIDPKTGIVTGEIDLKGLLPVLNRFPNTDVLNGIAWDAKGKRLFVTGKKWPKLFQISILAH